MDSLKSILLSQPSRGVEVNDRSMYLGGSGGTGKSRVIKALVEGFRRVGCGDKLFVTARTGVAATLIGGSTVDSLCKLKREKSGNEDGFIDDDDDDDVPAALAEIIDNIWATCDFLILDEILMLGCRKLAKISNLPSFYEKQELLSPIRWSPCSVQRRFPPVTTGRGQTPVSHICRARSGQIFQARQKWDLSLESSGSDNRFVERALSRPRSSSV